MRYELSDDEWAAIKPMLPNKPRSVPRVNDRRVLNGIFWVLRSGGRTTIRVGKVARRRTKVALRVRRLCPPYVRVERARISRMKPTTIAASTRKVRTIAAMTERPPGR